MFHKPLGDDLGHDRFGVPNAFSLAVAKRECKRVFNLGGVGGAKFVGHDASLSPEPIQNNRSQRERPTPYLSSACSVSRAMGTTG